MVVILVGIECLSFFQEQTKEYRSIVDGSEKPRLQGSLMLKPLLIQSVVRVAFIGVGNRYAAVRQGQSECGRLR